ncbi:MAG TPA: IS110 family transposase [Solirubrobacteraceae bacterium]|nr:IS110 family transposase [Solirubrobacteraceae bacterium]
MRRVLERCAALDVHKKQVTACARILGEGGELEELTVEFATMAADLLAMRDWLTHLGVTHVAMEATGVYWKPVYYALEDDFELLLVNAQHVKNVPGRKTDTNDAQWLCQLLECGLLRASFVPPKPIRELRELTRYRKALIRERANEANRLQKTLEDAGIKLSCVASDVLGVSGRLMLDALICGTRDPEVLAELAKGALRKKIPALRHALAGTFEPHHTLIVSHILAHLDYLDEAIATLSADVERRLTPFAHKAELLTTITGVAERNSQVILAELGPDMSRFPSDRHAASWVAICPGNDESAGKRRSGNTRRGNPHLRAALIESANAPARSKNTYLRAQYEQVKHRRGHKKAIVAVAHSILIAAYHILSDEVRYQDLGGDYFTRRADPSRIAKRLVAQLQRLGHTVTLETPTADGAVAA